MQKIVAVRPERGRETFPFHILAGEHDGAHLIDGAYLEGESKGRARVAAEIYRVDPWTAVVRAFEKRLFCLEVPGRKKALR